MMTKARMAKKSGGQLSMLLLLLSCVAATWSASHGAIAAPDIPPPHEAVQPSKPEVPPVDLILTSARLLIGDPRIQECWKSLLGTESCVTSVFQSILAGRLGFSRECCNAIDGLGDHCVPKMFVLPLIPSGGLVPRVIKGVCDALQGPAPTKVSCHPEIDL